MSSAKVFIFVITRYSWIMALPPTLRLEETLQPDASCLPRYVSYIYTWDSTFNSIIFKMIIHYKTYSNNREEVSNNFVKSFDLLTYTEWSMLTKCLVFYLLDSFVYCMGLWTNFAQSKHITVCVNCGYDIPMPMIIFQMEQNVL